LRLAGIAEATASLGTLPGADYVIDVLPAADIDRLEALWQELLDHRLRDARHLAALGVGHGLLEAARNRLADWAIQVMTVSVVAGNEGALRFYRREGAADYLQTLIVPVDGSRFG
jgi:GNAT superfamily N-acetyltransferase